MDLKKDFAGADDLNREFVVPVLKAHRFDIVHLIGSEHQDSSHGDGRWPSEVEQLLDQHAGIDAVTLHEGKLRFLALRTHGKKDYANFTVRVSRNDVRVKNGMKKDTEFQKLMKRLADPDLIGPHYNVESFITDDYISIAIAETMKLGKFINENRSSWRKQLAPNGDAFVALPFSVIEDEPWVEFIKVPRSDLAALNTNTHKGIDAN